MRRERGLVRARSCFVAVALAAVALSVAGAAMPRAVAARPTVIVVILGSGGVASKPAGISCPRACAATFAAGTRVLLTPKAKKRFRFLRWGGACTGTGACRVRVSAPGGSGSSLAAVAAEFVPGPKTQPPPHKTAAEPGSYSGEISQGHEMKFFVPADGRSVLNFSIPTVVISCAGSSGVTADHLLILTTAIKPGGSFTAKSSQNGLFGAGNPNAKFTYSVTGRFQGVDAAGAATATGTYRENIVYGTTRCTSNSQTWTATRAPQPPPKKSIQPGSYSGQVSPTGYGMKFFVPAGGRSVLSFSIPTVVISCAGRSGITADHLLIMTTTIKPDGSFTAKTSQNGLFGGANAKFTYSVTGYFQSVNAAGAAIAAGTYREDIVSTDGPTRACTSNDQSWEATRAG